MGDIVKSRVHYGDLRATRRAFPTYYAFEKEEKKRKALLLAANLFALSFLAGMMGLGVAFIATPVLGLFGLDLKDTIMPLALWLNGLTAISGAVAYSRAKR